MARLHVCCNGLGVVNMAKYDDDVATCHQFAT